MPDRFANGDSTNDDPADSKNLYDREKTRYYHGGDLQGIIDRSLSEGSRRHGDLAQPVVRQQQSAERKETYDGEPITDYHGYGAIDYYGVDEHLGNLAKLQELVAAAHRAGIKVIQDQVANHTGPYHPWVTDSPTPHVVSRHAKRNTSTNTWQTWTSTDPHSTPTMQRGTLDGWFINILPDLNQDDPEAARYLIQNTLVVDRRHRARWHPPGHLPYVPRKFWRDWSAAIHREYPGFRVVGESLRRRPWARIVLPGRQNTIRRNRLRHRHVFDFPVYLSRSDRRSGRQALRDVANMLAHDRTLSDAPNLVTFLGLHDVGRFMNERAQRRGGPEARVHLPDHARGIPMIYYGDEIGMRAEPTRQSARFSGDGRR